MRFAAVHGRASLLTPADGVIDLERATSGRFTADPQSVYLRWDELRDVAEGLDASGATPLDPNALGNPTPAPRQVFAIGLNYADHAAESSFTVPDHPTVFTKFVSSLTGPTGDIALPPGSVDWEVELVVVIGRPAHRVEAELGWDHVAGVTVGQDISERDLQRSGPAPQFSLGKSYPGFGPVGPVLATADELADPDDLELGCLVNGEQMQKGRTRDMVFGVGELIARLSAVTPLFPGDLLFTGTPAGVGLGRTPQRFLAPGDELVSYVRGVGEMRHRLVSGHGR
ncbi:fumarylacetoacetate hydrolase family protein [Pseudonocardia sp. D17]|uniref:fumarylacetoacetate hydrolase family protein n=1 Tax=Pseudonocardia sp. D17 TaxID=882661 RepID=UPI002B3930E4|nr:fumarylacetoacetate hydrolase [Pseudonocardia sp. D17]